MSLFFLSNRYQVIDQLGAGGMGTVYRAYDRLAERMVALKRVSIPPMVEGSTPSSDSEDMRLSLSREFRALASLRHPNIISVVDYGFDSDHQPYFTMDLLSNPRTLTEAALDQDMAEKVRLLVDMLRALAYVHRHRIVHRDLKPANVMVDADNTVKVLDFGLALQQRALSMTHMQDVAAGTIAYMAPELFNDESATIASDLYAVGVMIYEILTGHFPFNNRNIALLLNDILNKTADTSLLDGNLAVLVNRLLAKDPAGRYANADDVISALCEATGQVIPAESIELRESFLQASTFVGRAAELGELREALKAALDGSGSAWLVGGESGVGKSRLLDELRIRAMVRGALVLRGQSITEGSVAFQLWREPLRRLVIASDINDVEAGVLKTLIPDIDVLIARDVLDAPALDPQASQTRLLILIADLFRRQSQPLVVILEDLHWTGSENLTILQRLTPLVAEIPLLIVASYRDDERPELPNELPQMRPLRLNRLTSDGIAALSESILGAAGRQPQVVDFLQRETEGNAFFLVEVVRALAERAGDLGKIGESTLKEQVVARGIQEIIQRRLSRVPDSARPLLRLAAVAGRELDIEVLRTLETADFESWLTLCVNTAILEAHEDSWRFGHDKLREGVVAEISASELPVLHQRIAEAIERVHKMSAETIPALAHHYRQAKIRDKAIHYLALAAEQARAKFANQEAVNLYQLALGQVNAEEDPIVAQLTEDSGHVLSLMGRHDDALSAFQAALDHVSGDDRIRKSRLYRQMAKIRIAQHLHQQAAKAYDDAELTLGGETAEPAWWEEWLNVYLDRFTLYYWMYLTEAMEAVSVKIRPVLERYGTPVQRSQFAAAMSTLILRRHRFAGVLDEAVAYGREGIAAAEETGDIQQMAWAYFLLGFALLWSRQLDKAKIALAKSLELAQRTGDVTIQSRALTYATIICRKRGEIEGVRHYAPRAMDVAGLAHMPEYIAMAQANLAWAAQREGDFTTAEALASAAVQGMRNTPQGKMTPWVASWPLIRVRLLQGNLAECVELARELLNPVIQPQPDNVATELETAIRAWEQGDAPTAAQAFEQACVLARVDGYL